MEEKKLSQFQNASIYGIILGLLFIIWSIITYTLNIQTKSGFLTIVNILLILLVLIIGIKSFRDKALNGFISYGKALGTGTLISVISALILAIYTFFFLSFIDTDYLNRMLEISEEEMLDRGMSDEQIEIALEMTRKWMSPLGMSIMTLFSLTFWGFIISLIVSAFLQKKEKNY